MYKSLKKKQMKRLASIGVVLIVTLCAAAGEQKVNNNIIRNNQPNPEELIKQLDSNKDGKISKEEAKGPLKEDFSIVDKNADGFITLEELKDAPKQENFNHERPKPEDLLTKLDLNKDSKISKEEAKGPLGEDFQTIDTNNDGFINLEELKNVKNPKKKK